MKKAQSVIEVTLLFSFVVIAAIAVLTILHNKDTMTKLTNMSNPNVRVNLNNIQPGSAQAKAIVPYNPTMTETAGTNALTAMGTDAKTFDTAIKSVTYGELQAATTSSSQQNSLFDLANSLIKQLKLPYPELSTTSVTDKTIPTLVNVLTSTTDALQTNGANADLNTTATSFATQFKSMLGLS